MLTGEYISCSPSVYSPMLTDLMRNLQLDIPTLLEDGIELLVYAGEYDLICNWLVLSKDGLRQELEMDPQLPAVLLMGGGEGMGPVKKTASALGEALFSEELGRPIGQLVVICGRNQTLSSSLQAIEWKIPVKIRGFETQMEKWMGACDCIITKAGPGTIAEALIRGLPIILNDFIPGQEVGNVPYVVDNGAGVFSRSPKETASLVARWFSPESEELGKMSQSALKLAQPDAVFDIVKDIHELTEQRGPMSQGFIAEEAVMSI